MFHIQRQPNLAIQTCDKKYRRLYCLDHGFTGRRRSCRPNPDITTIHVLTSRPAEPWSGARIVAHSR